MTHAESLIVLDHCSAHEFTITSENLLLFDKFTSRLQADALHVKADVDVFFVRRFLPTSSQSASADNQQESRRDEFL